MSDTPDDPQLGDTLGTSRAGRIDPEIGATQGGSPSHERASYSDPITQSRSDLGEAADRVPGAMSTTPERLEDRQDDATSDAAGEKEGTSDAPMRGAGTPVRRAGDDGLPESPGSAGR